MFAKFGTLLLIVISAVLLFSVTADAAISVDYVGPDSSYDNYLFAGATQYSRADFNQPYGVARWYVRPPDAEYGTLVYTDSGDGMSQSSQFRHTFDTGSTAGSNYEISVEVFPISGQEDPEVALDIDVDSYTLGVWTHPDEVITTPDELTITDDIKIGDSYAFNVDVTSSSSNYVIDKVEVLVDGVLVASQNYDDVESATTIVSGNLSASAGTTMSVKVNIWGELKKLGKWGLERAWNGVLRGTITGFCECRKDGDSLGYDPSFPYTCQEESQIVKKTRRNRTRVRWSVLSPGVSEEGTTATDTDGTYEFQGVVPFGHAITMWIRGDDLHWHGDTFAGEEPQLRICKYEDNEYLKPVGIVLANIPVISQFPLKWVQREWVYSDNPVATYDPCDDPYPVEFEDDWESKF